MKDFLMIKDFLLKLKRSSFFGFLAVCSIAGAITGCVRKESIQLKAELNRRYDSIGAELAAGYLEKEAILPSTNIYLKHQNWEEAVFYFKNRYPNMYSLKAYLYGQNTLWAFDESLLDQIFYEIETAEGSHGFFLQNGEVREVFSPKNADYSDTLDTVRSDKGYDYDFCFLWQQTEDGSIIYEDRLNDRYDYIRTWENQKSIRFQTEIIETSPGELLDINTYRIKILDEKENEFLQEIRVNSTYSHKSPFVFEDFNADGYPDLTVRYYYGANGGSASHYIFSPSKTAWVELDSELSYYGMYSVDSETRRLYMHYHGTAIDGTEITYQWKNEMDYEIIKQYDHTRTDDGVYVKIVRYENGKEEILSDYLYSLEEYLERNDIWGAYYEDFIWETNVTDQTSGKKYMIRYAEVFLPEEAEKNKGLYYDGRIYVYDEDTYLIRVSHSEIVSQSDSIAWENDKEDKEPAVVIHYADGGSSTFYLSALIRPDYQPAG